MRFAGLGILARRRGPSGRLRLGSSSIGGRFSFRPTGAGRRRRCLELRGAGAAFPSSCAGA